MTITDFLWYYLLCGAVTLVLMFPFTSLVAYRIKKGTFKNTVEDEADRQRLLKKVEEVPGRFSEYVRITAFWPFFLSIIIVVTFMLLFIIGNDS